MYEPNNPKVLVNVIISTLNRSTGWRFTASTKYSEVRIHWKCRTNQKQKAADSISPLAALYGILFPRMSRVIGKRVFRYMRTVRVQISLRIRAVWSRPSLLANRIIWYYRLFQWRAFAGWCEFAHFLQARGHIYFRLTQPSYNVIVPKDQNI